MFRNQFSRKPQNQVKTGNFKKGAVAAAPTSKAKVTKAAPKVIKKGPSIAKCHARTVNSLCIRSMNYEEIPANGDDPAKKVIHIYFYDNLASMPLDYVAPSEDQDSEADEAFKGCSLIPLYNTANNGSGADLHLDALQDMFDDMIIAGGFEVAKVNDQTGKIGEIPAIYECILHSPTRTFITSDLGGTDAQYLDINYKIISEIINTPENAANNRYMWIGFYRDSEGKEPYFIKTQIMKYKIDNLYVGYGSTKNGEFVENDMETEIVPKVLLDIETFAPASNTNEPADAITEINKAILTKCTPVADDNSNIPVEINALVPPVENEAVTVVPEGVQGNYINGIPGYEVLLRFENEGTEQEKIVELQSRPISVKMPETLQVRVETITGNSEIGYDVKVPGCGMNVLVEVKDEGKTRIEVIKSSRIEKEGQEGAQDDVVAYIQNPVQPKIELLYPSLTASDVKDGVVTKSKSLEISHLIESVHGALVQGPIKVNNGKTGTEHVEGTLQFLDGVRFVNCTFKDVETVNETANDWMWLFKSIFENCDMQMKLYADIKDHLQIVGTSEEEEEEEEERHFPRRVRKGDRTAIPSSSWEWADTVDNLYAISSTEIKTTYLVSYLNFTYTPRTEEAYQTITVSSQNNQNMVLFDDSPGQHTKVYACYFVETKPTNIPEGIEDAVFGPVSGINFGTGARDGYLVNTYYGLCGGVEANKLEEIFMQVNKIIEITADPVYEYKYTYSQLNNAKKADITALVTRWKYIMSMIPINFRYIGELSVIFDKIVAFEQNRMPSTMIEEGKQVGLDTDIANNLEEVTEDEQIPKGPITYDYKKSTDESKTNYKWKENSKHAEMVEKLATLQRMMATNMTGADDSEVATKLYKVAEKFFSIWEEYYNKGENGEEIPISSTLIDLGEYEIYEEENVYETFIQKDSELLVAQKDETEVKADAFLNEILSIKEIAKLVKEAAKDTKEDSQYIVESVSLYANPIYGRENAANANGITEYSQFLATIQSRRNLIQRSLKGEKEVLIKFTQTARGTFFEILGPEPDSTDKDVLNGSVSGFYISKGYQGTSQSSEGHTRPMIPKGRYNRKMARMINVPKPAEVKAAPERGSDDWRLTIIPKFYEGEPLDWINDNYYTTFLFAQNADNLSIQLDPEFEARNKVIFTEDSTDNTKRLEQQMLGYFVAVPRPSDDGN